LKWKEERERVELFIKMGRRRWNRMETVHMYCNPDRHEQDTNRQPGAGGVADVSIEYMRTKRSQSVGEFSQSGKWGLENYVYVCERKDGKPLPCSD
jgi:hypothetical protein